MFGNEPNRHSLGPGLALPAAAGRAGLSVHGAAHPGLLGGAGRVRPAARQERRRPALVLHRRSHHGQQPHGRASRLGPHLQGRLPALPRHARLPPALSERLRLPGAMARGRSRKGPRVQVQARHRGLRARSLCRGLPRAGRDLFRGPDLAVRAPGAVDGLGQLLLHPLRQQHRAHLELPAALPRARLDRGGAARHALVRALRHGALAARVDRYLHRDHARRAVRAAAASRT